MFRTAHTLKLTAQGWLAKSAHCSSNSASRGTLLTTQCPPILNSHHSSRPSFMETKLLQQVLIHRARPCELMAHLSAISPTCFNSKYFKRRLPAILFNSIKDSRWHRTAQLVVFKCSQYLTIKRQHKDKSRLTRKQWERSSKQSTLRPRTQPCRAAAIAGRRSKLELISGPAAIQRTMR